MVDLVERLRTRDCVYSPAGAGSGPHGVGSSGVRPGSELGRAPVPVGCRAEIQAALRTGRRLLPPIWHRPRRRGLHHGNVPDRPAQRREAVRRLPHQGADPGHLRPDGEGNAGRRAVPDHPRPPTRRPPPRPPLEELKHLRKKRLSKAGWASEGAAVPLGPITIYDKSTLESLSVDEAVWFSNFYRANITPLFFVETLADLEKEVAKG